MRGFDVKCCVDRDLLTVLMLNSATVKGETLVSLFRLDYLVMIPIGAFCLTISVALITGFITGQY